MDADFFKGFTTDLKNINAWQGFHTSFRSEKKQLKDTANPSQLGDHVSLKAETADSKPTDQDRGAQPTTSSPSSSEQPIDDPESGERPSLSKLAKDTTIGDPVSIESEDVVEPSSKDKLHTKSASEAEETIVAPSLSSTDSSNPSLPALPQIDGESLFWAMMSASRSPDPYIFPALERLLKQNPRPILAALSNTVIYPPDHPWSKEIGSPPSSSSANTPLPHLSFSNPRSYFDVYVASAEVGMRKPHRNIYEFTIQCLDEFDKKERGGQGIKPDEIVFLDDIGENLKTGKEVGMKTIRVQLGKTWRAVKELEGILGEEMELMDERTRRAKL